MTQVLEMSAGDREELERLARSGVEPHRRVMAAKGLLALASGASVRATARALGSHQDTVRRWRDRFIESGAAGVGVYVDPPERAAVFSFDEKTQCQAIDRTQPSLPMRPGRARTMTHDYKRHGTTDLFAALDVATGEVLHQTRRRHTGRDVLAFFKWIDLHTPRHLDVHIVSDNLSAHKSQPVRTWLAHPGRERWRLHFTPTSASWLNLIEAWFCVLTRKALTDNSFSSVAELTETIDTWAHNWNHNPKPLAWTKTADDIIAKVKRGRAALAKTETHH